MSQTWNSINNKEYNSWQTKVGVRNVITVIPVENQKAVQISRKLHEATRLVQMRGETDERRLKRSSDTRDTTLHCCHQNN